jgi:hypothetical protein
MEKKKKKVRDIAQIAYQTLKEATQELNQHTTAKPTVEKNPAAVALGRLGGLKGGPAKVKNLSKKELREWGQKAAKARWSKKS